MIKLYKAGNVAILRKQLGLKQELFWKMVNVEQSTGSRYENDNRKIPKAVQLLIHLTHELGVDVSQINETNATKIKELLIE